MVGRVAEDGSGGVSEADFARFLDGEVSPRFPEGLTVIDAEGRMMTPPAGLMIREPAKLVMIVLPGDKDDAAITQAVIAMAHSLRLRVVAEGVETSEQYRFLDENQCDEMQGNYFSPPVDALTMARLLAGRHSEFKLA